MRSSLNRHALYLFQVSTEAGKITQTLHGHKDKVKCVRWVKGNFLTEETKLVSAAADGSAIIWSWNEKSQLYIKENCIQGHKNVVNTVDGFLRNSAKSKNLPEESSLYVATSSIDSNVMVWEKSEESGRYSSRI